MAQKSQKCSVACPLDIYIYIRTVPPFIARISGFACMPNTCRLATDWWGQVSVHSTLSLSSCAQFLFFA